MTILYVPPRRSAGQMVATRRSIFFQLRRLSTKQFEKRGPALVSPSDSFCSINSVTDHDDDDDDLDDTDDDSLIMLSTTPCSPSLPRPILKTAALTTSRPTEAKKQVHWSEESSTYHQYCHHHHHEDDYTYPGETICSTEDADSTTTCFLQQQQQQQLLLLLSSSASSSSSPSCARAAVNTATWYSRNEIANFRRNERHLFHTVPAVASYLVECRKVFEQMEQQQPPPPPQHESSTVPTLETNNYSSFSNAILRNGRCHYKGMERARVPWRVGRTRAIVKAVVQLAAKQVRHSNNSNNNINNNKAQGPQLQHGTENATSTVIAELATRLTATDQQWARFVAYLDEQEVSSSSSSASAAAMTA